MLSVTFKPLYAKWHDAECRYAECWGTTFSHYLKDNQSFILIPAQVASKSDLSGTTKYDQNHISDISKPKVGVSMSFCSTNRPLKLPAVIQISK
jgi:hypothetical protein